MHASMLVHVSPFPEKPVKHGWHTRPEDAFRAGAGRSEQPPDEREQGKETHAFMSWHVFADPVYPSNDRHDRERLPEDESANPALQEAYTHVVLKVPLQPPWTVPLSNSRGEH